MGLTNSVHPYCRFATHAMQMTPIKSCTHGLANGDVLLGEAIAGFELAFMFSPQSRLSRAAEILRIGGGEAVMNRPNLGQYVERRRAAAEVELSKLRTCESGPLD